MIRSCATPDGRFVAMGFRRMHQVHGGELAAGALGELPISTSRSIRVAEWRRQHLGIASDGCPVVAMLGRSGSSSFGGSILKARGRRL